jgi:hypothetical protein
MRQFVILVLGLVAAACGTPSDVPAAVRPTLDALNGAGLACDEGQPDNVPSGQTGWHCEVTRDGVRVIVELTGSDAGVQDITISTRADDPAVLASRFADLICRTPPFSGIPGIADALDGWTGAATRLPAANPIVDVDCSGSQCNAAVLAP